MDDEIRKPFLHYSTFSVKPIVREIGHFDGQYCGHHLAHCSVTVTSLERKYLYNNVYYAIVQNSDIKEQSQYQNIYSQ